MKISLFEFEKKKLLMGKTYIEDQRDRTHYPSEKIKIWISIMRKTKETMKYVLQGCSQRISSSTFSVERISSTKHRATNRRPIKDKE